ncbi:MAG: GDP-mannose 4,6-dehydratase [Hyphomicrobiaceae bacterium]|nr:GDP-mannose 4,6-dehydratase [Hyphomicrobiaceae bacterium]
MPIARRGWRCNGNDLAMTPPTSTQKRALITGISGQDGILLAELLLSKGYAVIGFGRQASLVMRNDLKPLLDRITLAYGDLGDSVDIASAVQDHQPHEVYNLASQSAPGQSWSRSLLTGDITGMGAHRLYEAVRRFKPSCRVYQASSSEMYGQVRESPQNEQTPFAPSNPYAAAKVYAHDMARIYRQSYGMFIACGILFNHESIHRGMGFLSQKVTYGAACIALGIDNSPALNEQGEPMVRAGKLALGNLDVSRDWGSAKDYVDAMWRMLQFDKPEDFVIGTGQLRTIRDLCQIAFAHVGKDWRDHIVTDPRFVRPSETGPTVADASKARRLLGWTPQVQFDAMIHEMVDAHVVRLRHARHVGSS